METYESFCQFVNKSLLLYKAPVLESLHLSLEGTYSDTDIVSCFEIASNRSLHELNVVYGFLSSLSLPRRTCETLVAMHLSCVFLNVTLVPDSFKVLKTLHLLSMQYKGNDNESFTRLLSKCPVLEDLEVSFREDESIQEFTINVTSLWKLCLHVSYYWSSLERYEIDTPCLEYLELADWNDSPCLVKNMPKLEKAHVDVVSFAVKNVIGSVTSVKHLAVCSEVFT